VTIPQRLVAALRQQLAQRPVGARRVGWKYGSGDAERIDGEVAVGNLTAATTLADGGTYRGGGGELRADAEVAVELGPRGEISGYAAALEICDLARRGAPEEIVASNIFHCAVAFGRFREMLPPDVSGALVVNGEVRAASRIADDVGDRVTAVARVLAAVGESLRPGDRIITGLIVQVPLAPGDDVVADLGQLGRVALTIA
jgi:hypothetical protein